MPEALRALGVRVETDPDELDAVRRDLWPRDTLRMLAEGVRPPRPVAVAWPRDAGQAAACVAWARERGLAVVPYGAGSGVCGGARGQEGALVVDTKLMRRVVALDPDARTVHVQAGILGQHLEDRLAREGWTLGHSPSSIWCSTVGGWLAARGAGQFSSRYGVFDDIVLAASAETPAGTLRAGAWTPDGEEDLLDVLAGSEGTLGVVTDLLLRIAPAPRRRWLRGTAFPDLEHAWEAMRRLMQAELWPSVLRLYDPLDSLVGGPRPHRERAPALRAAARRLGRLRALPLALPGLVAAIGRLAAKEAILVVGFEGPPEVVEATVDAARPLLAGGRDLGPEPGETWYRRRHDVSYKLAPIFAAGAWADTMEVAATWSRLPELHRAVRAALSRHAAVIAHFSHAYPEGCSIYFSFAGTGGLNRYDAAWAEALEAARAAGGTVTHHHGVGRLKARAAAAELGAALRAWREIRDRWDPERTMNPGALFPDDVDEPPGPPPPAGPGPVFSVDRTSLLARVDPLAEPEEIEAELARRGLAPRVRPDRRLDRWLLALRRGALDRWRTPVFAVQARFPDGVAARLGAAPRSAAGPDLRRALLRRARPEMVEIAVRPLAEPVVVRVPEEADPELYRPAWRAGRRWGFHGPAAARLAEAAGGRPARGGAPREHPTGRRTR